MGKIEFNQIIRWLPKLTVSEKRMLLKELGGTSTMPESSVSDWLLPGIEAELRRRGLSFRPLTQQTIMRLAPNYFLESQRVRMDFEARLKRQGVTLNRSGLIALGHVAARVLADYRSPVTPLGVKFLLQNVGNIPEAVEQSFPGYLAAGMLHQLIRMAR